jgi:predicted nuclease of restriction endonuclease-like (RecB) superfamily
MIDPAPIPRSDALPADYHQFLAEIKARIAGARTRAALAVNSELIRLYWEIGHEILERQDRKDWGAGVTKHLSVDLRREFANMKGLSKTNLRHMRAFAQAWPDWEICSQAVSKLPWGHNLELTYKLVDGNTRQWYAHEAVENGWSRNVLQAQIATDLRGRQGHALTSFEHALPESDSELVRDAIKDPYNFEFLGLVLCPGRSKTVTEWALRGIDSPVAIARYTTSQVTLTQTPPPEMKPALPDLPALASELSDIIEAANAAYDDESTEAEPRSGQHPTR